MLGQILGADARIDICASEDLVRVGGTDAINVAQGDFDALVGRDFYSNDASHNLGLTLALFVAGVGTDHPDDAFAADDFAIFAKLFD